MDSIVGAKWVATRVASQAPLFMKEVDEAWGNMSQMQTQEWFRKLWLPVDWKAQRRYEYDSYTFHTLEEVRAENAAIRILEQRRAKAKDAGDKIGEGVACVELGEYYYSLGRNDHSLGQNERAVELHEQHLLIAQEMTDRAAMGVAYRNLGNCNAALGREIRLTIDFYEQSLSIAQEEGNGEAEGMAYGSIGNCHVALGQYALAIYFHEQHKTIAQNVGDRRGEGVACGNLARLYSNAFFHNQDPIRLYPDKDHLNPRPTVLDLFVETSMLIELHTQELVISHEIGDLKMEKKVRHNLSRMKPEIKSGFWISNDGSVVSGDNVPDDQAGFSWFHGVDVRLESRYGQNSEYKSRSATIPSLSGSRINELFEEAHNDSERIKYNEAVRSKLADQHKRNTADGMVVHPIMGSLKTNSSYHALVESQFNNRMITSELVKRCLSRDFGGVASMQCEAVAVAHESIQSGKTEVAALIFGILGISFENLCKYERAIGFLEQERQIWAVYQAPEGSNMAVAGYAGGGSGRWHEEGQACASLGGCFYAMAQYEEAIDVLQEAILIDKKNRDSDTALIENRGSGWAGQALGDLGRCYDALGQHTLAIEMHTRALEIAQEENDFTGGGVAFGNIGGSYYALGYYEDAIHLLQHARKQVQGSKMITLANIGEYVFGMSMEIHEYAMSFNQTCDNQTPALHVQQISKHLERPSWEGQACRNLGSCYYVLNERALAVKLHGQARAIAQEVGDRVGEARACHDLGLALQGNGQPTDAAQAFARSLSLHQRVEQDVGAQDARRVSLFETQQNTYVHLQEVLLDLGHTEWALGVSDEAKARALSHGLSAGNHGNSDDAIKTRKSAEVQILITDTNGDQNCFKLGPDNNVQLFDIDSSLGIDVGLLQIDSKSGEVRADLSIQGSELTFTIQAEERDDKVAGLTALLCRQYEDMCSQWWQQMQITSSSEYYATRIIQFSVLSDSIAVWVVSQQGKLLHNCQQKLEVLESVIGMRGCRLSHVLEMMRVGMRFNDEDSRQKDELERAFEMITPTFLISLGSSVETLVSDMLPVFKGVIAQRPSAQNEATAWLPKAILEWQDVHAWLGSQLLRQDIVEGMKASTHALILCGLCGWQIREEGWECGVGCKFDDSNTVFHACESCHTHLVLTSKKPGPSFAKMGDGFGKQRRGEGSARSTIDSKPKGEGAQEAVKRAVKWLKMRVQSWQSLQDEVPGLKGDKSSQDEETFRAWFQTMIEQMKLVDTWLSLQADHFRADPDAAKGMAEAFETLKISVCTWEDLVLPDSRVAAERKLQQFGVEEQVIRDVVQLIRHLFSHTRILYALHTLLIAPIADALKGAEELLIIAHKELFAVPWAALLDEQDTYLIEHYAIRVAPSLSVVRAAASAVSAGAAKALQQNVVIVGNPIPNSFGPLPGATDEALAVLNVMKDSESNEMTSAIASAHRGDCLLPLGPGGLGQIRLLLEESARKSTVLSALQGATLVHVACHGDILTDSLLMAQEDGSTGELSMEEVQTQLKLAPGATVVLSACNTGRGKIMGEGVVGLSRGFFFAGAGAVVSTLWLVHDFSTKELMSIFYLHFTAGHSAPQAMRRAMLQLLHNIKPNDLESRFGLRDKVKNSAADKAKPAPWRHPKYWAAFVVAGASTSISRRTATPFQD